MVPGTVRYITGSWGQSELLLQLLNDILLHAGARYTFWSQLECRIGHKPGIVAFLG